MESPPSESSTLVEAPFRTRLGRFLDQARRSIGVESLGVATFTEALDGNLAPSWIAHASDGEAPAAPTEAQFDEWMRASAVPRPSGGDLAPCGAVALPTAHAPGPPSLLVWSSSTCPEPCRIADIAERIQQGLEEFRKRELAELIFAAVAQMADPFEITDREARLRYANPAWRAAFGHDPERHFGYTMARLFRDPDEVPHEPAFYQFTMASIHSGRSWLGALACRTAEGERRMAEVHVGPFESPRFTGNVAVRRQLAHREARDHALAVLHHEFRRILTALPDGVAVLRDTRMYFVNQSFLELVGRSEVDVIGTPCRDILHLDDRDAIPLAGTDGRILRRRVRRPDGTARIADISVAGSVSFEGEPATILVSRDVTDDQMASEILNRAERLSALGSLAAGLAHEINNPLAYLLLNLHSVRQEHGGELSPAAMVVLDEAIDGAERISRIVTDLRNFSGSDPAEASEILEIVDVTSAVRSALNIANNELRHRANVIRELTDGARALAREGPLVQVLVSLLVNAAQATPEGDSLGNEVTIRSTTRNGKVVLEVSDTGVGIPAPDLARVFDPFFTSKPRTQGSGLGLSIARRIVEGFDGTIELTSTVGEGTTVTLTLPQVGGNPSHRADPRSSPVPPPSRWVRARILAVDDEPALLRSLARVLRFHDVVCASSWDEAAAALDGPTPFDVVLCDLMMPGHSGPELYDLALRSHPGLRTRFVFMTGGAFADAILDFLKTWPLPVLEKPFDPQALHKLIQDAARGRFDPE